MTGLAQLPPLRTTSLPSLSTAMQKPELSHDTASSPCVPSMSFGFVQDPLYVKALPA